MYIIGMKSILVLSLVGLTACSAITGVEPGTGDVGFTSTQTTSPVANAIEIEKVPEYRMAWESATACLAKNGVTPWKYAPSYDQIHYYMVDAEYFFMPEYQWGLAGWAWGRTITVARSVRMNHQVLEHEAAHLISGEKGHASAWWAACHW
jgi:hypothetical protein